jgi:hypothetical protein
MPGFSLLFFFFVSSNILLVQRLGVINIFTILVYSRFPQKAWVTGNEIPLPIQTRTGGYEAALSLIQLNQELDIFSLKNNKTLLHGRFKYLGSSQCSPNMRILLMQLSIFNYSIFGTQNFGQIKNFVLYLRRVG